MAKLEDFPRLVLPKRFEVLEREAKKTGIDLTQIVTRVDDATTRMELLLRQVRDGGLGRFELFLGKSGSGKTTFLRTLPKFFQNIIVDSVGPGIKLSEVANEIRKRRSGLKPEQQIFFLTDRDNPVMSTEESRAFFESLRVLFREDVGGVVIVWPITDANAARSLSTEAWNIGRDSIVDPATKGEFSFTGLPKQAFWEAADTTTRSLNGGQGLEAFGLHANNVRDELATSDTIGDFYSALEKKNSAINNGYLKALKARPIPRVWILVAGDDAKELNVVVASLTQGTANRVDIDRFVSFLDTPEFDTAYLKSWKKRRGDMAYLMRVLDVRLFEILPQNALAAIRTFADPTIRKALKRNAEGKDEAIRVMETARFFRTIVDGDSGRPAALRATPKDMSHEFLRIQQFASKRDQELNDAVAKSITESLKHVKVKGTADCEKQIKDGNIIPDILVLPKGARPICCELTWRSTGREIPGEMKGRQATLSIGHIQQYVLGKVMDYVEELGL